MIVKTDKMMIDIDKVSFLFETNRMLVVDGQGVNFYENEDEDWNTVKAAFEWTHKSYMYDKNLKKIGGK